MSRDEPITAPVPPPAVTSAAAAAASAPGHGGSSGITIVFLCVGLSIIACCLLIPQADANRRLVYEREKLRHDLASIERQVELNDAFLQKMAHDPNLAERLAQRQLKTVRQGTRVLELREAGVDEMSPFQIVNVAPPATLPDYQPVGGWLGRLCYSARTRLYLMGGGLFLLAMGLVLGAGGSRR